MSHFLLLVPALATLGCARPSVDRTEWTSMGTIAALQTHDSRQRDMSALRAITQKTFADVERLLNAHADSSEISRLAKLPDSSVVASCDALVRPCYSAAFALSSATGGAFSPRWRGPATLDLGAIAKGFAVDLACEAIVSKSPHAEVLVDLGGNLRAVGGSWRTGVKNPFGDGFAAIVDLHDGEALATSATYYRGDHIVDARTNAHPAPRTAHKVYSVTVLCRSAMWADALSTALFILGPDEGRKFLSVERASSPLLTKFAPSVLWIMKDGSHITDGDHARFQRN